MRRPSFSNTACRRLTTDWTALNNISVETDETCPLKEAFNMANLNIYPGAKLNTEPFYDIIFENGLGIEECLQEMTPVQGNDCPRRTTILREYREFHQGKYSIRDEPRHIAYHQTEESLVIPPLAIHSILHDHLKVSEVCSLWVPHSSTDEHMTRRVS
ncbi:hypothetical protein LAZ67_11001202 [Cordylochernes scorpioides]|uniref:Uncharacterized protein n=1 Tax=Cordylochernes scorpioides TaxID=51811 RepID=A0ABY6KYA9_9ARAC|nr:hypothetical protein LAZ67_11001202 [Cordylochernes scorpioides]